MVTAGFGRPAYRWALGGTIAAIVLALLTATAMSRADDDTARTVDDLSDPVVSVLWRAQIGQPVTGPPAVLTDRVVVGGADGEVRAFARADGSPLWTFHAASDNPVYTRAADGVVYAVTGGGEIFAVDAGTGRQRWRTDAETTFSAQPALGKDRMYVTGGDSALHAYRTDDGRRRWRVPTGAIRASPTLVGDVAVAAGDDGRLYMASDYGTLRWKPRLGPPVGGPISVGDGACLPLADGSVRCVRSADGKKLAAITLPGTKLSSPARGDGVVFAAGADGAVGAWDKETGAQRWIFRPTGTAVSAGYLVHGAGQVVVAYPEGRLIGIQAGTGTALWEVTLPDRFDGGARLGDTAMYIVGRTGTLYALEIPAPADPAAPSPKTDGTTAPPRIKPDPPRATTGNPSPGRPSPSVGDSTDPSAPGEEPDGDGVRPVLAP